MSDKQRPDWVPPTDGDQVTTHVLPGVFGGHDGLPGQASAPAPQAGTHGRRRHLSVDDYVRGVLGGDRMILARAITLIESNAPAHMQQAQDVVHHLLPHAGRSIRVGITGVPGAGKSTLIEALGSLLCEQGHSVAVLAVDPSSSITRGSILGDKTRMERLGRDPRAFIRPSPSGGTLGGVARKSRETILVCEAAGFDVILIETMGVGQAEITVRSMVDFFLLLLLAGAGDELQGIKKGVIEMADALLINKADGENKLRALGAKAEYRRALHYLSPATEGWQPPVLTCSAVSGEGIAESWSVIEEFRRQTNASGVWNARRRAQVLEWVDALIEEQLRARFFGHPAVAARLPAIKEAVANGALPATSAALELLRAVEEQGS